MIDGNSHHVLLGDVALDVAVRVLVLEELGEGGVLGVPVQSDDVLVVAAQLGQRHPVRLPGRDLKGRTTLRRRVQAVLPTNIPTLYAYIQGL